MPECRKRAGSASENRHKLKKNLLQPPGSTLG